MANTDARNDSVSIGKDTKGDSVSNKSGVMASPVTQSMGTTDTRNDSVTLDAKEDSASIGKDTTDDSVSNRKSTKDHAVPKETADTAARRVSRFFSLFKEKPKKL